MDKFAKDYYGAFMKVEVLGFIRCESDLKYFGTQIIFFFMFKINKK